MKISVLNRFIILLLSFSASLGVAAQSVRQERRLINDGNKLYVERKFKDAAAKYQEALKINRESAVAKYNLGMADIRQVVNPKDTSSSAAPLLEKGVSLLTEVAKMSKDKPGLASKASYNLGNLEFNRENYSAAISHYKQSLRIDPNDKNAKKNLRIAQLKQHQQDQNKDNQDQNQNKDNQDNKQQDQQDKQNDKNDQKDQDKQNNEDKQDQKNQKIDQQTASQILQAIDNKESQTRARVNRANKGEKSEAAARRNKRW